MNMHLDIHTKGMNLVEFICDCHDDPLVSLPVP